MNVTTVPRVYSVGASNLGRLVTFQLAQNPLQPRIPEIVYLLKSEQQLSRFLEKNSTIRLHDRRLRNREVTRSCQVMAAADAPRYGNRDFAHIDNLIFAAPSTHIHHVLKTYKKNISNKTNILLLDSGVNSAENFYQGIFKDVSNRPNIYQTLCTHRVWGEVEFETNWLSSGNMTIARLPRDFENATEEELNYNPNSKLMADEPPFIKMLSNTTTLNPVLVSYKNFEILQIESTIVKACVEPLSGVLGRKYGELLQMSNLTDICSGIIRESVRIIKQAYPKVAASQLGRVALDEDRLLDVVLDTFRQHSSDSVFMGKNNSFMKDEPPFEANSTLVSIARKHKLGAHINNVYAQMVRAKSSFYNDDIQGTTLYPVL